MIEVPGPRLIPVDVDWRGDLAGVIAAKLMAFHEEKWPDTMAMPAAINIMVNVQEALDAHVGDVKDGRAYRMAESAVAILRLIDAAGSLSDVHRDHIQHLLRIIDKPEHM